MSKKLFQLYLSPLSAKYEDVDQENTVGEQQSEEGTGPALYAG